MLKHAVLLTAATILVCGCKRAEVQAAKTAEPLPVNAAVIRVDASPFNATVAVTGTLVSNARVDVKAETTGRVERFPKEEGDRVRAGEPVAWVEEDNYKLAVRQAESAVQVARAGIERARVVQSHARNETDRAEHLLASGGITDKDYKLAQVTEQEARAQISMAEAQLASAQASLDVARKRLADAVIKAPVDGEIQKKYVNPGAYVEPPTPVLTLVNNSRLELESSVPASDIGALRSGQSVKFSVNSFPGEVFQGRVIEVSPAVDADSRSAKVRIAVDGRGKLKTGMFAEGEIETGAARNAILIPVASVYRDDTSAKHSIVYVVQNGKAAKRAVRIGHERDSRLEIVDGLKPGDLLIAEQSIEIADGVKVAAREAGHAAQ